MEQFGTGRPFVSPLHEIVIAVGDRL